MANVQIWTLVIVSKRSWNQTMSEWVRMGFYPQKWKESEVAQLCPTLCDPMDCSLPGSSVHGISRQGYWSGLPFPSPGDLPDSGIEPGSPTLQADALPSCHFLLQGIFPTQESNLGLPHCRQTLYHLSHHGRLPNPLLMAMWRGKKKSFPIYKIIHNHKYLTFLKIYKTAILQI